LVFIGPPPSAIRSMGSKSASKDIMSKASVPQIPGYHGDDQSLQRLSEEAKKIGFPVLIKAVMGGGGKGMKIVESPEELEEALSSAKREAINSFGDDKVLLEKYILSPRHVEFQVFADKFGNVVHLNERDCSIQRRYQKVLEEAPAPGMTEELRQRMGNAAVSAAKAVGYVGAGTVEFILDSEGKFYFMEMNTRLQVEHPITEMITKLDLVEWQLLVAANRPLPLRQEDITLIGHAFEARIYAENPFNNFLPGTGKLVHLTSPTVARDPAGTEFHGHVRIETGVREGDDVSVYYDPMISKLIVWDTDRYSALRRMTIALEQYQVVGVTTNIPFLHRIVSHRSFIDGQVETGFIPKFKADLLSPLEPAPPIGIALTALAVLMDERKVSRSHTACQTEDRNSPFSFGNGKRLNHLAMRELQLVDEDLHQTLSIKLTQHDHNAYDLLVPGTSRVLCAKHIQYNDRGELSATIDDQFLKASVIIHGNQCFLFLHGKAYPPLSFAVPNYAAVTAAKGSLLSPMPGKVVKVLVEPKQSVKKGAPLMIMEAMKMEHTIRSPMDGIVQQIHYKVNDLVEEKKLLLSIDEK